mmetsp:Transcript_36497/g.145925  ORF Transcript_36497/g.145925 Transcript_36497/m.145925 type:complete len:85 (+) Transcript_36497:164-418(+)
MDDAGRRGRSKDLNLTYGEYDLDLFTKLLDRASPAQGDTFLDLGSGCGRYRKLSDEQGIQNHGEPTLSVAVHLHQASFGGMDAV